MRESDLEYFNNWFDDFCKPFRFGDRQDHLNISLKEVHTAEVCKNMSILARSVFSDDNGILLSGAVALFHDVGRFPQYARYKTYKDSESVNHAVAGAGILVESGVLNGLEAKEREIIVHAVKYHNAFAIPRRQSPETVAMLKLIRDADKIDIWRFFIEYFDSPEDDRPSAAALGYVDNGEYSPYVVNTILDKKLVNLKNTKTLNDYKLLQLSWIFDLNYKASYDMLLERGYIDSMLANLPRVEEIARLGPFLKDYAVQMSGENAASQAISPIFD